MNTKPSYKITGKAILATVISTIIFFTQLKDVFASPDIFNLTETDYDPAALQTAPQPATVSQNIYHAATRPLANQPETPANFSPFSNPAGCLISQPTTAEEMLANVQTALGIEYTLSNRREFYIWNGSHNSMVDVSNDPFVYEFIFNEFQHPLTYRGDKVATIFLTQGFTVWFREYNGAFRLMAIPMVDGVLNSAWADYVITYWQKDAQPTDEYIYPVMKKLPCQWMIDAGYVSSETLSTMFNLNWNIPNYLEAGRQYLAGTCAEAYTISEEKINYWDATSMCGPLAWTILSDTHSFPYRIGSWTQNAGAFTRANPRWNGQPWGTFDPETFTLFHTEEAIAGYDFQNKGNLYKGDLVYTYATLYVTPGYFDHIFLVADINENNSRLAISNMVQNYPYEDCSIEEVTLYTPGDRTAGVLNDEWNGNGFGKTGTTGFDVFRWNWVTYHQNGQAQQYTVRWGDTVETIAFDWKISPESLQSINGFGANTQLTPGGVITLPAPTGG